MNSSTLLTSLSMVSRSRLGLKVILMFIFPWSGSEYMSVLTKVARKTVKASVMTDMSNTIFFHFREKRNIRLYLFDSLLRIRFVMISLCSTGLYVAKQMGISSIAEISEAVSEKIMVAARGLNIWAMIPFSITRGK